MLPLLPNRKKATPLGKEGEGYARTSSDVYNPEQNGFQKIRLPLSLREPSFPKARKKKGNAYTKEAKPMGFLGAARREGLDKSSQRRKRKGKATR